MKYFSKLGEIYVRAICFALNITVKQISLILKVSLY